MAEYFPGYTPESSSGDDDSSESTEKKTAKKTERAGSNSKEASANAKAEKQAREAAVPLEKLAEDERSIIGAELARLRAEAAQQQLVEAVNGSVEQTEAIPVVEFDQALQRNLEEGQPFDDALENAEEAALELLGEDLEADVDENRAEVETDSEEQNEATEAENDGENGDDSTTAPGNIGGGSTPPTPPAGGAGVTPPNGPGGTGGGAGTANPPGGGVQGGIGGGMPPHTPAGPPGGPGGGHNAYPNPNVLPVAPNANVAPSDEQEQRSVAPYVLVGGLLGYMIGRRRGRIKTERRLLPVQKKLEAQVTDLEKQIVIKEERIRTLTRKQAEAQPALQAAMMERKQAQQAIRAEKQKIVTAEMAAETVVVAQKQTTSERLGKLAFRQEAVSTQSAERPLKPVERMTKPELLVIAEHIKVEQGDVKRLYEAGRLDDKGLRRVIEAYLSGESYERVLRDQLRSSEIEVQGIETDPTKISEQPTVNGTARGVSPASNQQTMSGWQSSGLPNDPSNPQQANPYTTPGQNISSYANATAKPSNPKQVAAITIVVLVAIIIAIFILF